MPDVLTSCLSGQRDDVQRWALPVRAPTCMMSLTSSHQTGLCLSNGSSALGRSERLFSPHDRGL
jgi:hypothetical protein